MIGLLHQNYLNINEVREKDVDATFSKSFSWTDSLNAA